MSREIQFDLPEGYEDDKGNVHRTVRMRAVRNKDLIKVANDTRVRELSKRDNSLNMAVALALQSGGDVEGAVMQATSSGMSIDMVKMHMVQAAVAELYSILFSQVVLSIGDITNVHKGIFEDLTQHDFTVLQQKYGDLNNPEEVQSEFGEGDSTSRSPFRKSGS